MIFMVSLWIYGIHLEIKCFKYSLIKLTPLASTIAWNGAWMINPSICGGLLIHVHFDKLSAAAVAAACQLRFTNKHFWNSCVCPAAREKPEHFKCEKCFQQQHMIHTHFDWYCYEWQWDSIYILSMLLSSNALSARCIIFGACFNRIPAQWQIKTTNI